MDHTEHLTSAYDSRQKNHLAGSVDIDPTPPARIDLRARASATWRTQHFGDLTSSRRLHGHLLLFWDGASKAFFRLEVLLKIAKNPQLPFRLPLYIFIYPEAIIQLSSKLNPSEPEMVNLEFVLSKPPLLYVPSLNWVPDDDASGELQNSLTKLAASTIFTLCFPLSGLSRDILHALCEAASTEGRLTTAKDRADPKRLYKSQGQFIDPHAIRFMPMNMPDPSEPAPAYVETPTIPGSTGKRRRSAEFDEEVKENPSRKRLRTDTSWAEIQKYIDDQLAVAEELKVSKTTLSERVEEIAAEVLGISDRLNQFLNGAVVLEERLHQILNGAVVLEERLNKSTDGVVVLEEEFSRLSKEVAKLPALAGDIDRLDFKMGQRIKNEVLTVQDQFRKASQKAEIQNKQRVESLKSALETRRNEILQNLERRAECTLRELRQDIDRGRVSDVVEGGAIAYMAQARGLCRSWWEVAMAGATGVHQAVRNVWTQ